jgi:carboxyl-terminal processing protease
MAGRSRPAAPSAGQRTPRDDGADDARDDALGDGYEAPRSPWRRRLPVLAGLVLAAIAAAGLYLLASGSAPAGAGTSAQTAEDLRPLTELYEALNEQAVDRPDAEALVDGAIEGMLEQVDDPYSKFFSAGDFAEFNASLDGTFSGVGLMLEETPDGPVIVSVLEGTPAQEAGIEEGERIVEVDGEDVAGDPLEKIVAKVKGEAGTSVRLGLAGGDEGRRTLEITRAEFDLPLVESELVDGDIGYVQLYQFADGAGQRVRRAVRSLRDEGARGIVLDLRGNPGGLLNEAISVASVFIEDGEIVSVQKRGGEREVYDAVDDAFESIPVVVLVDGNSASASEIVAGAVQDADRGTIVGETTFGKGTVQTIAQFSDGSGAKFTTARYYTPSGDSIEGVGVEPEVTVEAADPPDDEQRGGPTPDVSEDPQVQAAIDEVGELVGAGR